MQLLFSVLKLIIC